VVVVVVVMRYKPPLNAAQILAWALEARDPATGMLPELPAEEEGGSKLILNPPPPPPPPPPEANPKQKPTAAKPKPKPKGKGTSFGSLLA
jgi:hypothetical protein